ncbi:MAG: hypothetical protein V3R83_10100, partial [Gammaproteobacteria bacterium]
MIAKIALVGWWLWTAAWALFMAGLIIFVRDWDRVVIGNLVFHLCAGILANALFWTGWYDWYDLRELAWGLGWWIVLIYTSEFVYK